MWTDATIYLSALVSCRDHWLTGLDWTGQCIDRSAAAAAAAAAPLAAASSCCGSVFTGGTST